MEYLFDLQQDEERVAQLCRKDPVLAELIGKIGAIEVPARSDAFAFLVKSLIGQQLSVKAAATIVGRVEALLEGDMSPPSLSSASVDALRDAGVSRPKISYIQGLALSVAQGELQFDRFAQLDNQEVIAELTRIKGVGRWTAEMFLIFCLGREDVLSLGDAGLKRSARWLFRDDLIELEPLGEKWKPYRSIASLYLWEAINRGHVEAGPFEA